MIEAVTTIGPDGKHVLRSELTSLMASYEVEHSAACEKKADYIPTPEQIEQAKREVQETWSEREERIRAGQRGGRRWTAPVVKEPRFEQE